MSEETKINEIIDDSLVSELTENTEDNNDFVSLIIDDREQAIIPLVEANIENYLDKSIDTAPIITKIKRFNVGDYLIVCGKKLLAVIERKTLSDYSASFKDGRHLNKEKLLKIRELTGCDLYYFIEGDIKPKLTTKYANIPYKSILTSVNNLTIRDKIYVKRTTDKKHTIEELGYLTYCYAKLLPELVGIKDGGVEELDKIKLTPEQIMAKSIRKAWTSISFVSDAIAVSLMSKYKIKNLLTLSYDDDLDKIKLPSGRTINSTALKNLRDPLYIGANANKILQCCPSISNKIATIILTQVTISNLANMTLDEMKKLRKGKPLLGKTAEYLYTFINS